MDDSMINKMETENKSSGLSANMLKTIAIVSMLIDHLGKKFVSQWDMPILYSIMTCIGYTTAAIMFFFLVEGYHKTRNINRYLVRLGLFAIISYVPYVLFQSGALPNLNNGSYNYLSLNVIFTLFIGAVMLHALHRIKNPVLKWSIVLSLFMISSFGDWSPMGLVYVLIFDYYYGSYKKQAFAYSILIFCSVLMVLQSPIFCLVGVPFDLTYFIISLAQLGKFTPIILLAFYNQEKGYGGAVAKWGFYVFYPLHLLILFGIQLIMK